MRGSRRKGSSAGTKPAAGRVVEVDKESRTARERAVLEAAARVLQKRGPDGFNVRDVAKAAGASTIVVYTLFGSRDALLAALQRDGLERLAHAYSSVPEGDSLERLGGLALAYRAFALANPQYYRALAVAPGANAEFTRIIRASRAFRVLVEMVERCMTEGALAPRDPEVVADALWALVHGMVSFELGGYFGSTRKAEEILVMAGSAMLNGLRTVTPRGRGA